MNTIRHLIENASFVRNVVLTLTGLAVGSTAHLSIRHLRRQEFWLGVAWAGVTGVIYIIGRYVIFPQASIPYTGLVGWFCLFMAAIIIGAIGAIITKQK